MFQKQQVVSRIVPYILYEEPERALDWLARAFGFREYLRHLGSDGRVDHAEMRFEGGSIFLGGPYGDYRSPKNASRTRKLLEVVVYVDDVGRHFEHAKASGAVIINVPRDDPYGDRSYRAEDLEGHVWEFAQHLRDVEPEKWGAISASR